MKKLNKLGIIGIGDWGKNLVRDFSKISYIKKCTSSGKRENINWLKKNFPHIQYVNKSKEIFSDDEINAVIISTPIKTHYSLIKKALLSKKHVFVEKPISMNIIQANEVGCHIITATADVLGKLKSLEKDLAEFSLETVRMFYDDAKAAGYTINITKKSE